MKSNSTFNGIYKPIGWFVMIVALVLISGVGYSQVAINNDNSNPDASAMLDVKATGLGFLAPRMTFAQRPGAPATGLIIYQTDFDAGYYYYDGAAWQKVGRAADHYWMANGSDIYFNSGNVGVGTDTPDGNGINVIHYTSAKSAVRGTDESGSFLYAEGMLGVLNWPSNPMGLPIDVGNIGVLGHKPTNGVAGTGIYGRNNDANNTMNYAGIFVADGDNSGTNYALYADADSANTNYAGYFKGRVHILANGADDGAGDSTSTVLYSAVNLNGNYSDTRAVEGYSQPRAGYGIGVYGTGGYRGVQGVTTYDDYTGTSYGVYGSASGSTGTRIGVYGSAFGGTTNWAGYFSGNAYVSSELRVGSTTGATGYTVSVNGKIACEEILIDDSGFWPDYVFADDYDLLTIDEFEQSIEENNHLPGMPSAEEITENGGHHVGDIQKLTLEKVEELSLYIIELNNRVKSLEQENQELKAQISDNE